MSNNDFFPPRPDFNPMIYAYEDTNPQYAGLLKVGYTAVDVQKRVAQQYPTAKPGKLPYRILLEEAAMRSDGTVFSDHEVHRCLRSMGIKNPKGEWFECSTDEVKAAIIAVRERQKVVEARSLDFAMRPEQQAAVDKAAAYFKKSYKKEPGKTPHFLWNAKMRFGKTFTSYQLALKMGWRKVLVLTFKPAVQNAWQEDLMSHVDFKGWQFISPGFLSHEDADMDKPFVYFGSFQDHLGCNQSTGGIKSKNEWVHTTNWDCVILDEYHYGAWRESAKELFEAEEKAEAKFGKGEGVEIYDEEIMPITTDAYLYLSGTPFRAIASGEFIEDQIFNWTYSDEQQAKAAWSEPNNPYAALPRMVLMAYQLPDAIREIAMQGEFDEFDLNIFFAASGVGEDARFKYEDEVQKWLDLIRGSFMPTSVDNLKLGAKKPPLPFSDARLLSVLTHTFWFLPSVASCYAMRNLLTRRKNSFYHDYQVHVAAGSSAGIGAAALPPLLEKMGDPLKTKSITLSCGKLTTGVTVRPWTGIFMLRNSSSPETYFQAAFRVQSPWVVANPEGTAPNEEQIIKEECYVFDFAPDRALRQIADYSCRLNINESNPEKKVEEFISFLPVLAYDGSSMKQIDAAGILDIAMSGTSATLLARRWESALLVNVDNNTLSRLMNNEDAMNALMSIEGFRNLNQDLETIINKSEAVKKARKEKNDGEMTKKEKKELSEEEKEYKSKRKQIQEKLIKFATRVPVFMYLTDYRERCLRDVITQLEPGLFKAVTGLSVKDFELLVSLGVFNSALMNDAVFKFKRYEDKSLNYLGLDRHEGEGVGLYDTVLSPDDLSIFENVPEQTKQVTFDRILQNLYVELRKLLEPVLRDVQDGKPITPQSISVFDEFCAALPSLNLASYSAYRCELKSVSAVLKEAADVPFRSETRVLAGRLIGDDLPRLATTAISLSKERPPNQFLSFSRDFKGLVRALKAVPEPSSREKQISIHEFEEMLSTTIFRRTQEFQRNVREDMETWLRRKGFPGDSGDISLDGSEPFLIRQGIGIWSVRYEGVNLPPISRQKGMFYVTYLLTQPPEDSMHAIELEANCVPLIGRGCGIAEVRDPNRADAVPLDANAVFQERNLSVDLLEDDEFLKSQENQALTVLKSSDVSESEKESALEILQEICDFRKSHFNDGSGQASASAKRIRTAISRLIDHLKSNNVNDPAAKDAAHDFADHIEEVIMNPSKILWPSGGRKSNQKKPGHFTCELPPGINWVYQ